LSRHGKDEEEQRDKERLQCISEITEYYIYRDDGKLTSADTTIFYDTIQEHLYKENTLAELDTWLYTYRALIIQSKTQAAIEPKKRAKKKKNREQALKAATKSNKTTNTNNPRRTYQTRQQRKRQETTNTITTI